MAKHAARLEHPILEAALATWRALGPMKKRRLKKKLTFMVLAYKSGLSDKGLRNIEAGENMPQYETMEKIAKVLRCNRQRFWIELQTWHENKPGDSDEAADEWLRELLAQRE